MWCVVPLEMNVGNSLGQGYNRPTGCSAVKAPHATFNLMSLFSPTCILPPDIQTQSETNLQYTLKYVCWFTGSPHGLITLESATRCALQQLRFDSRQGQEFNPSSRLSRPAMKPLRPLSNWYRGYFD